MMRVLFIAVIAVFLAGCSRVQFAYNQLDWLIPYYVEKQVELTDSQDEYLQQGVDMLLSWHCSSHIESYADLLRNANTGFQHRTMSEEQLQQFLNQIEKYWKEIKQQASPTIAHLLLSSSDAQIEELFNKFSDSDSEWLERFRTQTNEELRLDYQENMTNELERWFGPLHAAQQQAVIDWSIRFEPLGVEGLKTRHHWQVNLQDLLKRRDDSKAFNSGIEQLFVNPETIQSTEYINRIERNTKITLEMIVFVGRRLDDGQREHLASMVDSVSHDFDQLACAMEMPEKQVTRKSHELIAGRTRYQNWGRGIEF